MKKFLIIISVILLPVLCSAQEATKVIVLNNGSQFPCTVVEETPTTVTVQNTAGEKFTYNKVEVKMITDKPVTSPTTPEGKPYTDYSSLTKGFWATAELGGGYNIHGDDGAKGSVPVEMDIIGGYRFSKYAQIGIGAGVRFYIGGNDVVQKKGDSYSQQNFAIPVFFNARGIMIDDKSRTTVPFWSANIGYTFGNGFLFSPAVGLRIGSLERHHFTVAIAYTLQQAYVRTESKLGVPDIHQGYLNSISLRIGYQF